MRIDFVAWDDEDDAAGNVRHIAEHGLSTGEVQDVLFEADAEDLVSRSSGRPGKRGWTRTGRIIVVFFEVVDDGPFVLVRPITAYEVEP